MSLNNSAGTASIKTSQHTLTTLVYQLIVHMYHIPWIDIYRERCTWFMIELTPFDWHYFSYWKFTKEV